jgi:hypothetical protein
VGKTHHKFDPAQTLVIFGNYDEQPELARVIQKYVRHGCGIRIAVPQHNANDVFTFPTQRANKPNIPNHPELPRRRRQCWKY